MSFNRTQQAVEKVQHEYDDMREQGIDHTAALDHLRLQHGVERRKLAAIIANRGGDSGETIYGCVSTPSTVTGF